MAKGIGPASERAGAGPWLFMRGLGMGKNRARNLPAFNEAAAVHWFGGALKEVDVPLGEHCLGGVKLTITAPPEAKVIRAEGSLGDGYEEAPPATITLAAALLFIKEMGTHGPLATALFRWCITRAAELKLEPKNLMTLEATEALRQVQAEMQPGCRRRVRTPASRIGVAGAKIKLTPMRSLSR